MKKAVVAFTTIAVVAPVIAIAAPATAAPQAVQARNSTPETMKDCHLRTSWSTLTLTGSCGRKKINVRANRYNFTVVKGHVFGKKFVLRYKNTTADDGRALSGVFGGKKLRYWGNGNINTAFRFIDGRTAHFGALIGFKGQKGIRCEAKGKVTGPDTISWKSTSFRTENATGKSRRLSGSDKMWGACATVIASQYAFNAA